MPDLVTMFLSPFRLPSVDFIPCFHLAQACLNELIMILGRRWRLCHSPSCCTWRQKRAKMRPCAIESFV